MLHFIFAVTVQVMQNTHKWVCEFRLLDLVYKLYKIIYYYNIVAFFYLFLFLWFGVKLLNISVLCYEPFVFVSIFCRRIDFQGQPGDCRSGSCAGWLACMFQSLCSAVETTPWIEHLQWNQLRSATRNACLQKRGIFWSITAVVLVGQSGFVLLEEAVLEVLEVGLVPLVLEKMRWFLFRAPEPPVTLREELHPGSGCRVSRGFIMERIILIAYRPCPSTSTACSTKWLSHL